MQLATTEKVITNIIAFCIESIEAFFNKNIVVIYYLGTAKGLHVITKDQRYISDIILVGVWLLTEVLCSNVVQLFFVSIVNSDKVLVKNSAVNLQPGIYYRYIPLLKKVKQITFTDIKLTSNALFTMGICLFLKILIKNIFSIISCFLYIVMRE